MPNEKLAKISKTELDIFEALVKSEHDIVGLIAFALYKRSEFQYIARFYAEHGNDPDENAISNHRVELFPNLNFYFRKKADHLAQSVSQIENVAEIVESLQKEQTEALSAVSNLQETLKAVHSKVHEKRRNWLFNTGKK